MSCRLGPRGRRRSDLNGQQNRTVSPARFRSSRLPSPCEEQALRNAVSPRHLAHHGPRHQRLFNDPRLLVLAPTPSALDPENLPIHLCMTLRLAQRSYPSRRTPSQQGGRRRTDTETPAITSTISAHANGNSICGSSVRVCADPECAQMGRRDRAINPGPSSAVLGDAAANPNQRLVL